LQIFYKRIHPKKSTAVYTWVRFAAWLKTNGNIGSIQQKTVFRARMKENIGITCPA
jgi:hypothetical protein